MLLTARPDQSINFLKVILSCNRWSGPGLKICFENGKDFGVLFLNNEESYPNFPQASTGDCFKGLLRTAQVNGEKCPGCRDVEISSSICQKQPGRHPPAAG